MKPHGAGAWGHGSECFLLTQGTSVVYQPNLCCSKDSDRGGYPFLVPGSHQAPHPHFSSLVSHPDQPEFTPVQDEQEAMDLWSSSIWRPQKMSEEQWQALFWSFNLQDVVSWLYATLQGRQGSCHRPIFPPWVMLIVALKNCVLKPSPFGDTVAALSLCCFNCMPVNLVVFQRRVWERNRKG